MVRFVAVAACVALTATAAPPIAHAAPVEAPRPSQVPITQAKTATFGKNPTSVRAHLVGWNTSSPYLHITARTDPFRVNTKSKARRSDKLTVQLLVRQRRPHARRWQTGAKDVETAGPILTVRDRGAKRWLTGLGGRLRVHKRTGRLTADVPLTTTHARALRQWDRAHSLGSVRGRIFVRVIHYKDTEPTRGGYRLLQAAGVRPTAAGTHLGDTYVGNKATFELQNSSQSPLILLTAPSACMYDTRYEGPTLYHPSEAQMGTLNGSLLKPGQVVQFTTISDAQNLDGPHLNQPDYAFGDFTSTLVGIANGDGRTFVADMADYPLPDWALPPGNGQLNPDEIAWEKTDSYVTSAVWNLVETTDMWAQVSAKISGLWNQVKKAFGAEVTDAVETYGVLDVAGTLSGPVFGLTYGIEQLFKEGCNDNPSFFALGAVDANQPWLGFAQVYNFGAGKPGPVAGSGSTSNNPKFLQPISNGIITNSMLDSNTTLDAGSMAWVQPWDPVPNSGGFWQFQGSSKEPLPLASLTVTNPPNPTATCWVGTSPNGPVSGSSMVQNHYNQWFNGILNKPYEDLYNVAPTMNSGVKQVTPQGQTADGVYGEYVWEYGYGNDPGFNVQYVYEDTTSKTMTVSFSNDGLTWQDYWVNPGQPVPVPAGMTYAKCNGQYPFMIPVQAMPQHRFYGDNPQADTPNLVMGLRVPSNVWAWDATKNQWQGKQTSQQAQCAANGGNPAVGTNCGSLGP